MRIASLAVLAALLSVDCSSSGDTAGGGKLQDSTAVRHIPPPNQIQQNSSEIEAVVDSVASEGDSSYRIGLFVRSAAAQENGFAAQGEHITARPEFVLKDEGTIDTSSPRTQRLLALRTAHKGDVLRCSVSLGSGGAWYITDVLK